MVYLKDLQEYTHQSTLLLSARPATTKITTRYTIAPAASKRSRQHGRNKDRGKSRPGDGTGNPPPATEDGPSATAPAGSQATLTLKTYDPVSGVVLKYRTDRAAEVGRLMAGLNRCGNVMAALPEGKADVPMEEAGQGEGATVADPGDGTAQAATRGEKGTGPSQQAQQQQGKAGGAGKKKKKR